jgi:hypothetical protein
MSKKAAAMSIQLSEEQGKALDSQTEFPPRVVDPRTNRVYVLVDIEQYERVKALLEQEQDIRPAYAFMEEVAASEGWDHTSMDLYFRVTSHDGPGNDGRESMESTPDRLARAGQRWRLRHSNPP